MENKKDFDNSQKNAINIDNNAVVSAGAGSGKTTVLAERFAHLVLDKKYNVDEILTLTFTKKATTEMYGRIYKTLRSKNPDSVKNFYKANIKTLDSYCSSIAKLGARFYGVSPDFTVDKDSIESQAKALALPFVLEHRDNPAVKSLVSTKDYETITEQLFVTPIIEHSTLAEPIDFDNNLACQKQEVIREWNENVKRINESSVELSRRYEDYTGNKDTVFLKNLKQKLDTLSSINEVFIDDSFFKNMQYDSVLNYTSFWNDFISIKLTNGAEEIKEEFKNLKNLVQLQSSLLNFIYSYNIIKKYFELAKEFQDKINNLKRTSGILSFADASSIALCTLRDHPEIRIQEKKKYKAIMIDEFQDNNSMQKDMLFLLAENLERTDKSVPEPEELIKDKLFFVGDEKQSIYKFRGADVSVFRNLSKDFADGNLEMKTNYRSNPALIASFNTIFGGECYPPSFARTQNCDAQNTHNCVFYTDEQNESVPDFEAIYHSVDISESAQKEISSLVESLKENRAEDKEAKNKLNAMYAPHITVALYDEKTQAEDDDLKDDEAEALWVATEIKKLITEQNCKPQDIAILLRAYTNQPMFERALLAKKIPYTCEVIKDFFNDGPTNDIFAFLKLCAYQNDTLAYAKLLCSPFFNLSIDEAQSILSQDKEPFADGIEDILQEKSRKIFVKARDFFISIKESCKTLTLSQLITKLWYEAGYYYETIWNESVNMYASMYDRIFELARLADSKSQNLAEFVDSVRTYEDAENKLDGMDIPLEQTGGVQLLTIHKSKGLQFPVVFVCNANKKGRNEKNAESTYFSSDFGVTVNTPASPLGIKDNYFFIKAKEENKCKSTAELRRLVYVALTRAQEHIYITGTYSSGEKGLFTKTEDYTVSQIKHPDTILKILSPAIEPYYNADKNSEPVISPFRFETIQAFKRTEFNRTSCTKEQVIQNLSKRMENSVVLKKEYVRPVYMSPSHLYADEENSANPVQSASLISDMQVPFSEINRIIEEEPRFTYASFGTIAHAYMEAAINGTSPVISNRDISAIAESKQKLNTVYSACEKMQDMFKNCELGKKAAASAWHKAEYAFKSRVCDVQNESGEIDSGYVISGTMDLVFQNADGSYTIVDYKTNEQIKPELYLAQLACYRQAVSRIFGCSSESVRCILYYLRYGKEVDITNMCGEIDIDQAARQIAEADTRTK